MGAALGNHAVGNGHDAVGVADGAQAVGNDQGGTAHSQIVKGPLDLGFRHRVQCGGGFVQNQNGRILQENPGNGNALLLTAGQEGSPLAHIGVEALRHSLDILIISAFFAASMTSSMDASGLP